MLTKTCTACGVEKSVDEYYKIKAGKYGVKAECKCCSKAYYLANREAKLEQQKAYKQANKEVIAEKYKAYSQVNKEALAKKKRVYRQANKEAIAKQKRAYIDANKEFVAELKKVYRKTNRHIFNAFNAKRRATKLQATPAWADLEAIKGMYKLAAIFNSTGINLHVDHIVPLISDKVCGLHCEANLQLLSASDNIKKGNRQWPDM
jgi:hypothetical protein